ncbi:MAG: response regulator transcription factor [Ruminococcus sp.]|nr:response regulator transcription factor [Ruminococcus sp.]
MSEIMIVDDDIHIGNMLEETLHAEGYLTLRAFSGTEALMLLESRRPDLILLDLMLPGLSGEDLLPKIEGIPVIVVSAKADVSSKVGLLLGGAVDYVTKPFDISELLARIAVALRQSHSAKSGVISACGLTLDTDILTVTAGDTDIRLTRTECAILKLLMQNEGTPVGRSAILDRISADTPDCTERSLKQHVSNIRRKLQAADGEDHIEAVYGIGFMIK